MNPQDNEIIRKLEDEYSETKLITIIKRGNSVPKVEWDINLSEDEVIATLVKALLFMTIDDFLVEMIGGMDNNDNDDDE